MTKYQVAQFKRAIKREISKEKLSPQAKNHRVYNFPSLKGNVLPDYIANNPWY